MEDYLTMFDSPTENAEQMTRCVGRATNAESRGTFVHYQEVKREKLIFRRRGGSVEADIFPKGQMNL
jgi:hypothetical protein